MTMNEISRGKYDRELQIKLCHMNPFINYVERLKQAKNEDGTRMYSEEKIAQFFKMSVPDFKRKIADALEDERKKVHEEVAELEKEGWTTYQIAVHIGKKIHEAIRDQTLTN